MNPAELSAIAARARAADPACPSCADGHTVTFRVDRATADFFADARGDVLRLAAEVEALRHALRRVREIDAGASAGIAHIVDAALGED